MTGPVRVVAGFGAAPGFRPTLSGTPWRVTVATLEWRPSVDSRGNRLAGRRYPQAVSVLAPVDVYDTEAEAVAACDGWLAALPDLLAGLAAAVVVR